MARIADVKTNSPSVRTDLETRIPSQGFLMDELEKNMLVETFRHIKRPLLRKAMGRGLSGIIENQNVIMIVSAHPAEGKTFVSANLATSIAAEKDKEVLLIDADIARSSISRYFDIQSDNGFVEYLLGESSLADVTVKTDKSNFNIVPAGRRFEHTTELFASKNTQKLVRDLATEKQNRVIIIDSPPLFAASEALSLAELAGQVVVVVESGSKPKELKEALGMLDLSRVTGTIFNKSLKFSMPYYYGYGLEDR